MQHDWQGCSFLLTRDTVGFMEKGDDFSEKQEVQMPSIPRFKIKIRKNIFNLGTWIQYSGVSRTPNIGECIFWELLALKQMAEFWGCWPYIYVCMYVYI